uniref:Uncharacterized protein n=1 Tax=Spironucleus salmonicida TaxID=348837 RepID=V6LWC0_9EUKA|eukprot:EST48865.1 Hypothetical protein SS50377_10965 [Spironucleus salmonicida]
MKSKMSNDSLLKPITLSSLASDSFAIPSKIDGECTSMFFCYMDQLDLCGLSEESSKDQNLQLVQE